jgi:Tfp pilus assembly protein PilN
VREVKRPVPAAAFDESALERTGDGPAGPAGDVLSAFSLATREEGEIPVMEAAAERSPWLDYFEQAGLETVRGRDYYASIMKGAATDRVFIAGDGAFLDALARDMAGRGDLDAAVLETPAGLTAALAAGAAAGDKSGIARVNLAPEKGFGRKMKRLPMMAAAALVLALALFFAVDYLRLARGIEAGRARLAAASRRAEAARILAGSRARLARELKKAEERRQALAKEAAALRGPDRTGGSYSRLIAGIAALLPAGARCDRIEVNGDVVEIRGRAVDHGTVERFVERLRRSGTMNGTRLDGVLRNDRETAPLDFSISGRIGTGKTAWRAPGGSN